MTEPEAIYNIGVVSRMTDIPAATLRIWERRYGFPQAARTEGGHRLYSDREVQRLRWVKARVDNGMQIRQAVRALEVAEQNPDSVAEMIPLPQAKLPPELAEAHTLDQTRDLARDSYLAVLQQQLYDTLIDHNTAEADRIFSEGMALYTPEDLILNVIRPTLVSFGSGWERGNIGIATEHIASAYLRQRLIMWLHSGPPAYEVPPTVLACAPGEYHEGSLLMIGALLRRRRWPVQYVGQSTPLPDLASLVKQVDPLAITVVALTEGPAQALSEWPTHMPEAARTGRPAFTYGGRIFNVSPEWRALVPGLFLGTTLSEGVETLERILRTRITGM